MGLCLSNRKSGNKFKDKGSKICGQIQSAVSPIHLSHDSNSTSPIHSKLDQSLDLSYQYTNSLNSPSSEGEVHRNSGMAAAAVKKVVSRNRNRYKLDGFDLDLTYITPKLIAMGYPASNIEGLYRNDINQVVNFFETKHKGHYYIYNLCSERNYDKARFDSRVKVFPFDDHNPPTLELIIPFCEDVDRWLRADPENVAGVHCKAGKGRTGTMICCYLLHNRMFTTAEDALRFYGEKRTVDHKGVTIPSQLRYVKYYEDLLKLKLEYKRVSVWIKEMKLSPCPNLPVGMKNNLRFFIYQQTLEGSGDDRTTTCVRKFKSKYQNFERNGRSFRVELKEKVYLTGDVKIEFYYSNHVGRKEKLFQFWFNTFFFVYDSFYKSTTVDIVKDYCKSQLDIISKTDRNHKVFPKRVLFQVLCQTLYPPVAGADECDTLSEPVRFLEDMPSVPEEVVQASHSDSGGESVADQSENEEDEWDSGECSLLDKSHDEPGCSTSRK